MHELISELYISYIKALVNFLIKCLIFRIPLAELPTFTKSLQNTDLFYICESFGIFVDKIYHLFDEVNFARKYRLYQKIIELVFVDLTDMYQYQYILLSEMLQRFNSMRVRDAKKTFIFYVRYFKLTESLRLVEKMIASKFDFDFQAMNYHNDINLQNSDYLREYIEEKELQVRLPPDPTEEGKEGTAAGGHRSGNYSTTNYSEEREEGGGGGAERQAPPSPISDLFEETRLEQMMRH